MGNDLVYQLPFMTNFHLS